MTSGCWMKMIFDRVQILVFLLFSLVLVSCSGLDKDRNDISAAVTFTADGETTSPSYSPALNQPVLPIFMAQSGTPAAVQNFIYPSSGCAWLGVAGQAFGLDGEPVSGLLVLLNGVLDGVGVSRSAMTGSSQVIGPGGFDIPLADHLTASSTKLSLQLFDLGGNSLSRPAYFDVYADCEKNLVILNFIQVSTIIDFFFPLVIQQSAFP